MKLAEAIRIANTPAEAGALAKAITLVCGFTPLHLATFIKAYGQIRVPFGGLEVNTGLYGDLPGNLERADSRDATETALILEWFDVDPRLGLRTAGGWGSNAQNDIIHTVERTLNRLATPLERLAQRAVVAVSPPTLPLPPIGCTVLAQASPFELQLRRLMDCFLMKCSEFPGVRILNSQRLSELSPLATRRDAGLELAADFPYSLSHADELARLLVDLLFPASPKKGLVTDLDDTLWQGILGEVGVDGVTWDHSNHSQVHALYQQFLSALAESGVLLGVATKNDPSLVSQALNRQDLLVHYSSIFPVEAHWGPKSESVSRILQAWNIGPDSLVFIDDSPLEIAEVQSRYPEITCLLFPRSDAKSVVHLLSQLRDLFGKPKLVEEDRFRVASLRTAHQLNSTDAANSSDDFLRQLEAQITLDFRINVRDVRAFDLINKTNQFNLNGRRFTQSEWMSHLEQPGGFMLTVCYKDKFGPLGKIAVVTGRQAGRTLHIENWVMSCRAFSRCIEYHTLERLFAHFSVQEVAFAYRMTDRNQPLQEFLGKLTQLDLSIEEPRVLRDKCAGLSSELPHIVHEITEHQQEVTN